MTTTRAFWFIPFRHVAADDLERWFESMADKGWVPTRLGQWSSLRMRLAQGQPKTCRYVIDMQPFPRAEYFTTFRDSGWEHAGQMASMHVWRREYSGHRPEAFSDTESRQRRSQRLALAVTPSAAIMLVMAIALAVAALAADTDDGTRLQLWIAASLGFVLATAIGAAAVAIWRARRR